MCTNTVVKPTRLPHLRLGEENVATAVLGLRPGVPVGISPNHIWLIGDQQTCEENDPTTPFFDEVHELYHRFFTDHVIATDMSRDRRVNRHWVSRDLVHWVHLVCVSVRTFLFVCGFWKYVYCCGTRIYNSFLTHLFFVVETHLPVSIYGCIFS